MIVAVAFSCISTQGVAVRGIVFCPDGQSLVLLNRLSACGYEAFDDGVVKGYGTGRDWVKKHFNFVDTSPPSVQFSPLTLKRYFAFARVDDMHVRDGGVAVGFDVFRGPGNISLPMDDGYKSHTSSRAIHGFAHVTHQAVFHNSISQGQGDPMTGHAALCFIKKADEFLSQNWTVRSDSVFEVVPNDEVEAVMMIQAPAHWGPSCVSFNSNTTHDKRQNLLEQGFVFRAGMIVKLSKIRDRHVVGL